MYEIISHQSSSFSLSVSISVSASVDLLQAATLYTIEVVVVAVTFFNHNFVNCKASLILAIKNLGNKRQYKPK